MDTPSIYGWYLPTNYSAHGAIIDQLILIMHVFSHLLGLR